MSKVHERLDDQLRAFIAAQHVFFVATAPLDTDGHLNLSPRGCDTLRVLDDRTVAWLDNVGSGAETIAHLRENRRVVLMLCAFAGPPKILRLHGRGDTIEPGDPEFATLRPRFATAPTVRAIIRVRVERISDSCGWGVPLMRYEGERPQFAEWASRKGEAGVAAYQREKNARSIDGLPALRWVSAPDQAAP
jgi:hypothetical protein